MTRIRTNAIRAINRTALKLFGARMMVVLCVREIPRIAQRAVFSIRSLSPRKGLAIVTVAGLICTPTVLFFVERGHRNDLKHSYDALSMANAMETSFLEGKVKELLHEQTRLTELLLDSGYAVRAGQNVHVKVIATGYSSSVFETDDTPFTTAYNTRTREGVLALSRDLLRRYTPGAPFDFGDKVHIPGVGEFIVEDSMNARWENRVDVWFPSQAEAIAFGVREVMLTASLPEPEDLDMDEATIATKGGL